MLIVCSFDGGRVIMGTLTSPNYDALRVRHVQHEVFQLFELQQLVCVLPTCNEPWAPMVRDSGSAVALLYDTFGRC